MASKDPSEAFVGTAVFRTGKASRYIAQLCKHFAHKVEASFSETEGRADLPGSLLLLRATPETLEIELRSDSLKEFTKGRYIVEDHIVRFAFREKLYCLNWSVECVEP